MKFIGFIWKEKYKKQNDYFLLEDYKRWVLLNST